ncbi:MAG: hypothetical protein H5U40_03725 [Polyangiaceae bacterium]|nr:hypothetical protein [Polyangiaceae bacterium]
MRHSSGVCLILILALTGAPSVRAEAPSSEPSRGLAGPIRRAFQAHVVSRIAAVTTCHAETSERSGGRLVTHLVFQVRVSPEGSTGIRIVDRTRLDSRFERCLLEALGAPRFDANEHEAAKSVLYDQVFTSEGPELPTLRP